MCFQTSSTDRPKAASQNESAKDIRHYRSARWSRASGKRRRSPRGGLNYGPLARYEVAIRFPPIFPKAEPIVFETGNSIPHDAEDHINPDGTCCIVIWEAWASSTKEISVQDYFDDPLRNYFLGQYQKAATGKWPFGEERHGKEGLIDAFSGRLSCTQNEKRMRYSLRLLSKDWPKGYWDCPCGSGKIVRQCCAKHLARLAQDVPKQDAKRMLSRLKSYDR